MQIFPRRKNSRRTKKYPLKLRIGPPGPRPPKLKIEPPKLKIGPPKLKIEPPKLKIGPPRL